MDSIDIPWGDLGLVTLVGLVLGAGVTTVFAIGIRVLSPAPAGATEEDSGVRPTPARIAITALCFAICAAAVVYGIVTLL
jgi:hypothetical protein